MAKFDPISPLEKTFTQREYTPNTVQNIDITKANLNVVSPQSAEILLTAFGLQSLKKAITSAYVAANSETKSFWNQGFFKEKSYLGTPLFNMVKLSAGGVTCRIPISLIEVGLQKNIVRTEITGSKGMGAVNELISNGNYSVQIRGLAMNYKALDKKLWNDFPADTLEKLNKIAKMEKEVEVTSVFLNSIFDITKLVIQYVSIEQKEASHNVVPFTINAFSEEDLNLEIK